LSITNEEVEYMTIEDRRKAGETKRGKTQKKKSIKGTFIREYIRMERMTHPGRKVNA
jgi:hypothetical protein